MAKRRHHHPQTEHSPAPTEAEITEHEQTEREQTELLAYQYWQKRGCPEGDPETDWLKAEHEVARQREAATRL